MDRLWAAAWLASPGWMLNTVAAACETNEEPPLAPARQLAMTVIPITASGEDQSSGDRAGRTRVFPLSPPAASPGLTTARAAWAGEQRPAAP